MYLLMYIFTTQEQAATTVKYFKHKSIVWEIGNEAALTLFMEVLDARWCHLCF